MIRPVCLLATLAMGLPCTGRAQLVFEARAGHFDRRLADRGAVERQTGVIAGGSVGVATRVVILSIGAAGGKLAAKSAATADTDYGRVHADLALVLGPAVRFHAEMLASVFASETGSQRWMVPRVGFELRAPFSSIPVTAHFRGAAALGASTNASARPRSGFDIRGGVEAGNRNVTLVLQYQLQRLTFPVDTGRQEQWGELSLGIHLSP